MISNSLLKIVRGISMRRSKKQDIKFPGGLKPIDQTDLRDVFVVGFPKSGNTLMQHIIAHLIYGLNHHASRSLVNLIIPDIYANTHYFRFNTPCYFKSHELPNQRYRRVIYIIRDGREALLSYYHMQQNMNNNIKLEDLYTGKLKIFNSEWHEHVERWIENPFQAELLILKYEELKINKISVLKRLCDFLNIERTEEELLLVDRYTSFEHMKNLENREDWKNMKKGKFRSGKSFVRKGLTNSYLTEVDIELIKSFESRSHEVLNKFYRNEL